MPKVVHMKLLDSQAIEYLIHVLMKHTSVKIMQLWNYPTIQIRLSIDIVLRSEQMYLIHKFF